MKDMLETGRHGQIVTMGHVTGLRMPLKRISKFGM
jgi:hypothetical protein